ncbi:MAG: hypothetical protein KAS75_04690 [Planctomycetes bacterium]|nr:hypothetical protein [Planctomycetota bacterium]
MTEQLLTPAETAARLGLKKTSFYKYRPKLRAFGLQEVRFGACSPRYRESSVDVCIKKMAESEAHLVTEQPAS